jgi:hypothetical protein
MFYTVVAAVLAGVAAVAPQAGRRGGGAATATFAIAVVDPAGAPLGRVKVTVEGPSQRSASTEGGGKIAFENLPAGSYRLRFEKEGFVTLERDVTARGSAPISVDVTMTPAPKPAEPPPPAPEAVAPPPKPPDPNVEPVAIDVTAFFEKNFVGRGAGKISPLACTSSGNATLIQLNEPAAEHVHVDADEYVYVMAGEGTGRAGGRSERLKPGTFMLVPRGVPHSFAKASRSSPLVLISTKSGEGCSPQRPR